MNTECIFPGCSGRVHVRGLCKRHYELAGRMVRSKQTTWEKLQKTGKCLGATWVGLRSKDAAWFLNQHHTTPTLEHE